MRSQDNIMTDNIYDPAYVAALFDRCSPRYRRWSAVSSFGFVWLWRRQCVDRLRGQFQIARIQDGQVTKHVNRSPQIVDLMAGTGESWPHIFDAFPRAQITAIDISVAMHTQAIAQLHQTRSHQITHFKANALETDLSAHSADMVVATFGLKTFDAHQQTVLAGQIARILREGGCFSLIEASDPKGWLLRPFYRAYLDHLLPRLERLFLQGAQDFSMIGTYTRNFGDCAHMADALRSAGLNVTMKRHFFGCATSLAGTKPIAPDAPAP
jgi:ubiquinone/menaquinone biosynthesis C-methylase UbiE